MSHNPCRNGPFPEHSYTELLDSFTAATSITLFPAVTAFPFTNTAAGWDAG
jgi:hypothetical protein